MSNSPRRQFDSEFKLPVAGMVRDQGLSVSQGCSDLNRVDSMVRRRVTQYDAERTGDAGIGKPLTADQQRIRPLEAQVRELKANNDFLKKASALFARELKGSTA